MTPKHTWGSLSSDWRQTLGDVRRELWTAGVFSAVINACMLMPSLYMLQVYDRVLVSQSELTLLASSILLVAVLLLAAGVEIMRSRLLVRTGIRLDQALAPRLFDASLRAQMIRPAAQPAQFLADLTQVRQFVTGNGIFAFFDAPWFFIYVAALFVLHPLLGWVGLVFAGLLLVLTWLSQRWTSQPLQTVLTASVELANDQAGKLRNASTIESMGMLQRLRRLWWGRYLQLSDAQGHLEDASHRLSAASKFMRYTQQSLSLGAGAWLVVQGELSPGAMIVGNMLMTRALQPLELLVGTWRMLATAQAALDRLQPLVCQTRAPEGSLQQEVRGDVQLDRTVLYFEGQAAPVLQDINLHIPAGQVLGVVGPSGSGKSSLARLILGSLKPSSGQVRLDGADLPQWHRETLGHQLGYLPQEVELLDGTLAQNIARFDEPDSARVVEAASAAGIHDMILRLPQGYDTQYGEQGERLSAGQKQRVALARALYGWPKLVLLDEPNSNLDEAGHLALAQALDLLREKKSTVVLISHRLSILGKTDALLVLRNGRIQAQGPSEQVLSHLHSSNNPVQADPASGTEV